MQKMLVNNINDTILKKAEVAALEINYTLKVFATKICDVINNTEI